MIHQHPDTQLHSQGFKSIHTSGGCGAGAEAELR